MLKSWLKSSSDNVPPFPQASTGCATPAPSAPPSGAPPPGPAPRGALTTSSSLLQTSPHLVQVRSVLRLQCGLRVRGDLQQHLLQLGRRPRLPLPDAGVQGGDRGQCRPPRAATCVHVPAAGVPAQTQLRHVRDRAAEHQRARGHGPQQQGQLHTGHMTALDLAISSDVSVIITTYIYLYKSLFHRPHRSRRGSQPKVMVRILL